MHVATQVSIPSRVYALHMARTNIEIDEELIRRVMRRHALPTKRAAVDFALRKLDMKPMTREEALAMQGSGWHGDLDAIRGQWVPWSDDAGR